MQLPVQIVIIPSEPQGVKSGSGAPPGHTAVFIHGYGTIYVPGDATPHDVNMMLQPSM